MKIVEGDVVREPWDKKRVAIALFLLLFIAGVFFYYKVAIAKESILPKWLFEKGSVAGDKTQDPELAKKPNLGDIGNGLRDKLNEVKDQVGSLNVSDVAGNSPQFQKVMKDFQALQNLPHDKAKETCLNICKSL